MLQGFVQVIHKIGLNLGTGQWGNLWKWGPITGDNDIESLQMFFWAIPILRLKQFCLVTRLTLFSIFTGRIEENDKPWTLTREELKYVAHRTFMISYVFV